MIRARPRAPGPSPADGAAGSAAASGGAGRERAGWGRAGQGRGGHGGGILILLIAICVAIEAALVLSDLGWIAHGRLRRLAYAYGGFWPGLLDGWQPNFAGQAAAMFLTYGFLHGGIVHLGFNMFTLWSLGRPLLEAGGRGRFLAIWAAAQLLGGCAYAALSDAPYPMVGASGALFGLAGAWLAALWNHPGAAPHAASDSRRTVLRALGVLLVLNLAMMWALRGQLAWQTHLGGFVAGWILAARTGLRPPAPPHPDGPGPDAGAAR